MTDYALLAKQVVAKSAERNPGATLIPGTVVTYNVDDLTASVIVDGDSGNPTTMSNISGLTLAANDRVMVTFAPPQGVFVTGLIKSPGFAGYRQTINGNIALTDKANFTVGVWEDLQPSPALTQPKIEYACLVQAYAICSVETTIPGVYSNMRMVVQVSTDGGLNYDWGNISTATAANIVGVPIAGAMYSIYQAKLHSTGDLAIRVQAHQDAANSGDITTLFGVCGYTVTPAL